MSFKISDEMALLVYFPWEMVLNWDIQSGSRSCEVHTETTKTQIKVQAVQKSSIKVIFYMNIKALKNSNRIRHNVMQKVDSKRLCQFWYPNSSPMYRSHTRIRINTFMSHFVYGVQRHKDLILVFKVSFSFTCSSSDRDPLCHRAPL